MHDGDHQIGPVHAARSHNISHHLLVLAPGHTRQVGASLETARVKFVVAQHRNAQAFALEDQRRVGLLQVHAAADLRQTGLIEQRQHLGKGLGAKITRMVVGQGHGIEVALQHRDHARMGAKGVHLVTRVARCGNHALQVGDADISPCKGRCEMRVRVAAIRDQLTGCVVEHAVARKDQSHALRWRG